MCGICGKLNFDRDATINPTVIGAMLRSIRHRGPDDEGVHQESNLALGHRRLSIIDLSTGHQPLSNEDSSIWIVFNGEIYNFRELHSLLASKGHVFRTKSDTEVIVHLYEELGPECVQELRGMFAFAIWDSRTQTLFLARDRVGIKPLYYISNSRFLSFASEIKALLADPEVKPEIAPEVIDRFLTFLYLPGEETLLKGVHKLPPASYLLARNGRFEIREYWDLRFGKAEGRPRLKDAERNLLDVLSESVAMHMIADVPVGVLLSGGLDSTAVLSFAIESTEKKVSSYTVGFSNSGVADERPYARLAADAFGTEHHDTTITATDFAEFMFRYVWHMEEPVCEPPAIALYYVSKLARNDVKVLLSGEGGDEAFAGYSNYRNLMWLERAKRCLSPLNGKAARGLALTNAVLRSQKVAKYLPLLDSQFPKYYYSRTSSASRSNLNEVNKLYTPDFAATIDRERTLEPVSRLHGRVRGYSTVDAMLYIDTKSWLPDDLLVKADKMTMANSVELRVPFLDHKILEFAATLPADFKVRGLTTKYIAKRALGRRVPESILNRPKAGFPVPYETWLHKDLRAFVNGILRDGAAASRKYFSAAAVDDLLDKNQAGAGYSKEVFSLVTLELWQRAFLQPRGSNRN